MESHRLKKWAWPFPRTGGRPHGLGRRIGPARGRGKPETAPRRKDGVRRVKPGGTLFVPARSARSGADVERLPPMGTTAGAGSAALSFWPKRNGAVPLARDRPSSRPAGLGDQVRQTRSGSPYSRASTFSRRPDERSVRNGWSSPLSAAGTPTAKLAWVRPSLPSGSV